MGRDGAGRNRKCHYSREENSFDHWRAPSGEMDAPRVSIVLLKHWNQDVFLFLS